jgi:hypothetical protein
LLPPRELTEGHFAEPNRLTSRRLPAKIGVQEGTSQGKICSLGMVNLYAKAEGGSPRGSLVHNEGTIDQRRAEQTFAVNLSDERSK